MSKKRFIVILAAVLMIVCMAPRQAYAASFSYYDPATGETKSTGILNKVIESDTFYDLLGEDVHHRWENPLGGVIVFVDWFVSTSDYTITNKVSVSGSDINLIIQDGVTLTCSGGIEIQEGSTLTIWAESGGSGTKGTLVTPWIRGKEGSKLIINGCTIQASGNVGASVSDVTVNAGTINSGGLWGGNLTINNGTITTKACLGYNSNTITINNGNITSKDGIGNKNANVTINNGTINSSGTVYSGINGSVITINNGNLTLQGGSGAAAIGGDNGQAGGQITINGGTIIANGGMYASGIGGGGYQNGPGGQGGNITINGGNVTATGGDNGAGIGGGSLANGGNITINGGTVKAYAGHLATGIGGGFAEDGGNITISGGNVSVYGSAYAAAIGGGAWYQGHMAGAGGTINISGGTVTAEANGDHGIGMGGGYDNYSGDINFSFTNPGTKITASSYHGTVKVKSGQYFSDGTYAYSGTLSESQKSAASGSTLVPIIDPTLYVDADGNLCGPVSATSLKSSTTTLNNGRWYIAEGNLTLPETLTVNGSVNLILADNAVLTVPKGVKVEGSNSLTIYAQSTGSSMGKLIATGSGNAAGIGSGQNVYSGTIIINGGSIKATGGTTAEGGGAGIGGGYFGSCHTIEIHSGIVDATGGSDAAGIGCGGHGLGGTTVIDGGTITAKGSGNAAGIGGGAYSAPGNITISGDAHILETSNNAIGGALNSQANISTEYNSVTINGGTIDGASWIGGKNCQVSITYTGSETIPSVPSVKAYDYKGTVSIGNTFVDTVSTDKAVFMPGGSYQSSQLTGRTLQPGVGYRITQGSVSNCSIQISNLYNAAQEGDTVTITVVPFEGTELTGVTVKDEGDNEITLEGSGAVRTFTMPAGKAIVSASCIAVDPVTYLDPTAEGGPAVKNCYEYTVYNGQDTLTDGWYVVKNTGTTIHKYGVIKITGDVNLILEDGCDLDAAYGIEVIKGDKFTVWAQSDGAGMGKLTARPEDFQKKRAAIGAPGEADKNSLHISGTITINGGKLILRSGEFSAGIGGGKWGGAELVTINGGDIDATGGDFGGAGIGGGGANSAAVKVVINGGKINAQSQGGAAGIGGGNDEDGSIIVEINGGTITASGSDSYSGRSGSGIGGGYKGSATVTITGGTINASGGTNAFGIGQGEAGSAASITLSSAAGNSGTMSVTSSSYGGTVALSHPFKDNVSGTVYGPTGSADNSALAGTTLIPWGFHSITVAGSIVNGSVTAPQEASEGTEVTITVTPDKYFKSADNGIVVTYNDGTSDQSIYPVQSAADPSKYTFTMPGYDATVGAAFVAAPITLSVTADAVNKPYGGADPELTYTVTGFAPGDDESVLSGKLARASGEQPGTYDISQGTLSAGANYTIDFTGANFKITPAILTVTADAVSKTYGSEDPEFTYTASGFVFGDDKSILSGVLGRTAGENAGAYAINKGSLSADVNYEISFTPADLTIEKAALTVTADAASKTYGQTDPAFTYTAFGFVNSDSETVMSGTLSRTVGEDAGKYSIGQGSLSAGTNYDISFTGADLTIEKAALTVTANAASKTYGQTDPAFTYTASGFVNSDTEAVMSGALSRAPGEVPGTYDMIVGSLNAGNNYDIVLNSASFTINKAALTVVADAKNKIYGETDPELTYTVSGFVSADDESLMSGALARAAGEDAGTYAINKGTLSAGDNYEISFTGAVLTISRDSFTVGFETNGGNSVPNQTVLYLDTVTKPSDPIRYGYKLAGWFGDKALTQAFDFNAAVKGNATVYAKWDVIDYSLNDISGGEWRLDSGEEVVLVIKPQEGEDHSFELFLGVDIDGVAAAEGKDYTAKKGSTIITLLPQKLQSLSVGSHTVTVNFSNTSVSTNLTVMAASAIPPTGDTGSVLTWMSLILASAAAIAGILVFSRKRREN